jgi:ATP-dependent protease Clp ATPase subunit
MKCSFCKRDESEVFKLVAANDKIAICDECIMDCLSTLIRSDEVTVIDLCDKNA